MIKTKREPDKGPAGRGYLHLVVVCLVFVGLILFAHLDLTWAQPSSSALRQTIPSITPTATTGPAATPTATVGACLNRVLLQDGREGYTGTSNTWLDALIPMWPRYGDPVLRVKAGTYSTLIRFDLIGLPSDVAVAKAELVFFVEALGAMYPSEVAIYRVLRPWDAQRATWQQASAEQNWGTPGCEQAGVDRVAYPDDTITLQYRGIYQGFDVTESVRHWLAHPEENYGWLIKGIDESGAAYALYSSFRPESEASLRPILRIDYYTCQPEQKILVLPLIVR